MREGKRPRPASMYVIGSNSPRPKVKRREPNQCHLKFHYNEVMTIAERFTRKVFCRTNGSYNVYKRHKYIIEPKQQSDNWVTVHNLRQLDGGILDPDDRLKDVADDREQIIANFDEFNQPHQGDGISASDHSETSSPDIFQNSNHRLEPFSCNGIEITDEELTANPPPLHVRRGSEPALNSLSPIPSFNANDQTKRWSAAAVIEDDIPSSSTPLKDKNNHSFAEDPTFYDGFPGERGEGSGEEKKTSSATSSGSSHHSATTTTLSRFSRDSKRCSVQILSDNTSMTRWAEAADRAAIDCQPEATRREPVGGVTTPTQSRESSLVRTRLSSQCRRQLIVLPNDGSSLGIHVIPSTDQSGNNIGLVIEGIDHDGRIARKSKIQVHDIVIEINGKSLRNVSFHRAQEIFQAAMKGDTLRLVVIKNSEQSNLDQLVDGQQKTLSGVSKVANVTATRKVPAASLSSRTQSVILQSNTRKIGKKVSINLVKGDHGLGFSITTRDNPAGGEAPIYIKNILPKGAAIEEGTLKIGDRLLEVNSIAVTGYNQSDVANLLRQIQVGKVASLIVSRQERPSTDSIVNFDHRSLDLDDHNERNPDSPKLPRQLLGNQAAEKSNEDSLLYPWKHREIVTFEIPVHDSERAGLGVSVKGKTSNGPNGSVDLGIFVKNVIHGGAASKDGRLRQNDQLVNINAISLLKQSNSQAMTSLRTAMYQEGPIPGMITLTIARRLDTIVDGSGSHSGRDSVNSLGTISSGTETVTLGGTKSGFVTPTPHNFGMNEQPNSTMVYVRQNEERMVGLDNTLGYHSYEGIPVNPVIQRITGGNNNQALRNESYYRATHETWNSSQMQHLANQERECHTQERNRSNGKPQMASPTIIPPLRETVIIHDDVSDSRLRYNPASSKMSSGSEIYSNQGSQCSEAYISQSSLEESLAGFSRDQVGRQSISEKRHATLDAKSTDTYQRSKKAREERDKLQTNQAEALALPGCTEIRKSFTSREVGIDIPERDHPVAVVTNSNTTRQRIYQKNQVSSSKLYGLKALSKLSDLKSYAGKSMTLQPSNRRSHASKIVTSSHLRSLRNLPSGHSVLKYVPKAKQNVIHENTSNAPVTPLILHKTLPGAVAKKGSKSTFGQELSTIIHNWASRNHTLLGRSPTPPGFPRASSEESLQNFQNASKTLPRLQDYGGLKGATKRTGKEVGPGLGMRKSSSLESLQTMVQEMTLEENGERLGNGKVPRGRGCNESFRAAVDRSYDAPLSNSQMETVNEEECELGGSGVARNHSRQSSVHSLADDRKRHYRKKPGILKGLGSMFRFGKHRKTPEPEQNLNEVFRQENFETAKTHLQDDNGRTAQECRTFDSTQREYLQNKQVCSSEEEESKTSRWERMHQLRAQHQKLHVERNRTYPTDDIEERYDYVIKQVAGTSMGNKSSAGDISSNNQPQTISSHANSSHDNENKFQLSNAGSETKFPPAPKNYDSSSDWKRHVVLRRNKGRSLHRSSLYSACLRPIRKSPSPPNGCGESYLQNTDAVDVDTLPINLHSNDLNRTDSATSLMNNNLAEGIREYIIQTGVSRKPPLPPRNMRSLNNNYKPPAPPSHNKPVYSIPQPNPKKLTSKLDLATCKEKVPINENFCALNELIGPNFSFSFNKPLQASEFNIVNGRSESLTTLAEIEAQNLANETQSDLGTSKLFYESQKKRPPHFYNNHSDRNIPINNCVDYNWSVAYQTLSSGSSTTSSNGSVRSNSLPRMGLKGKTAAKLIRNCPSPAPVPPPKGLRNPLAPLHSTEVLDQCRFWRMEPVPPEPKAEIEHIRSKSSDVYGSNRKRQARVPFQHPNNYSHYVNYEQIQMHLRKNKEQERLAQLASQQYQDFRDKQTRRVFHPEEKENEMRLLHKLEERFIHESVMASREQREYQSQRSSRDTSFQQRPISNYFEYESVQAMMSHAQDNHSLSSLPRRTYQNSSFPHAVQSNNANIRQGEKDPQHKTHGVFKQASKSNDVNREGIYAASGFRPASQYQYNNKTPIPFQQTCHPANSKV